MISKFKAYKNSLQELAQRGTAEVAREVVEESTELKNLAIRLNRSQLIAGTDAKGNPTGQYAEATVRNRRRVGLQTNHKDYKFTGSFFRNFYVAVVPFLGAIFKVDSTDRKRDRIVEGSGNTPAAGEDIFGLTPDSLETFREKFKPKFLNALKRAIRYR